MKSLSILLFSLFAIFPALSFAQCTPVGDPSVFGDHVWNVYTWNAGGQSDNGTSWNTNYSGYYVDTSLNFNSQSQWSISGSPSDAIGYQGCPVAADNHSWSAKRTGFPCGYYRIDIGGHDDEGELFINGTMVWIHDGCCDTHSNVWSGILSDATSIEFRVTEGGGSSYGSILIVPQTLFVSSGEVLNCAVPSITLSTTVPPPFQWSTGATTPSITVNTPGTYSLTANTGAGCNVTSSQTITSSNPPTITLSGPNCTGNGNLTASASRIPQKLEWKLNGTTIQTDYSTYTNSAQVIGSASSAGVCVDDEDNVYACDYSSSSVLKWAPGSTTPVMVAGGNGIGAALNQFNNPSAVYVDHSGNIYVCDANNYRVQEWTPGATSGITVAGGNGFGSGLNQLGLCYGLFIDNTGNIYVSDILSNRVIKWAPGTTQGTVVAGGNGSGGNADQLFSPIGLYVDNANNLYIADQQNNRIQKWAPGASSGITIAGGNGGGFGSNQLYYPRGIVFDPDGNLIISNYSNSYIVKWTPGAPTGTHIAGYCCTGTGAVDGMSGLAIASDGTLYCCGILNNQMVEFNVSNINTTLVSPSAGDYSVVATSFNGCASTSNTVTVNQTPIATITGNNYYCAGSSTTLDAGAHQQYAWSNGATTESTSINSDGNYSVTVTDNGCSKTSSTLGVYSRTPVITITPTPSSVCYGNNSQLKTSLEFSGSKISLTYYISASQLQSMSNICSNGSHYGYYFEGSPGFTFRDSGVGTVTGIQVEVYIGSDYYASSHSVYINGIYDGSIYSTVSSACYDAAPSNYASTMLATAPYNVGGNNTFTFQNNYYFGLVPGVNTNNYYAKVTVDYLTSLTTSYSWAPTGDTSASPTVTPLTTTSYTVTTNTSGCIGTQTTAVAVNPAPGDTSVFGNSVWNVYAFNDGGQYDTTGHSWTDKYSGYYTDSSFNFNTESKWNRNGAPSDAPNYNGCPVNDDSHSWSAKRRGFPCGIYQIDVPGHDDAAELFVNGVRVWEHDGCCDSHTNVWTGFLDNNSTVVFRGTEGLGNSYGSINLTLQGGVSASGPTNFCPGYSVQLTAGSSGSYLWNTGDTSKSITVTTSGNYSVNIINNGCTNTFSQQVTVAALDTPTIYSSTNFGYCPISLGNLYIQSDPKYHSVLWSNGIPFPGINVTPGNYSVTVSDVLGCSATSHATIVSDVPGTDSSFGTDAWKVNAYAQGYYSYYYYYNYSGGREWDPQDYSGYYIDTTLNFNSQNQWNPSGAPSDASGYLGCAVTNDIMSWSAKRRGFACGVYQIDVTSHDDDAQLWVDGVMVWEDPGCCNPKINAWTGPLNASSTVEFKVNDQGGGSSGSLQFTQLDSTVNFVTLTGHPLVCTGQSQVLTSSILGNYLWSNGGTVNPLSVSQSGNYSVTVTDVNGCVLSSAPVAVSILPDIAPVARITTPTTNLCNWNSVTLSSDSSNGNSWSTNETTQSISANIPNDYILTITNSAGCYDQDTVHITGGFTPPSPVAGNGGSICSGSSATLTASGLAPGGQVASFDGTNQYIDVTQDIPENNFTIEMWVKTTAPNTGIFSVTAGNLGDQGNDRHLFLYNGILYARVYNSNPLNSGIKINDGHWHHIALTVQDSVGQKIYVDGDLSPNISSYDHSDFTSQTDFLIGFSSDALSNYFNGQIDNVRIWSEARTQEDIQNNIALETPLSTDNLVYASSLNGNLNVTAGNVGIAPNEISYAAPDYYTYSWTGNGAPTPSTSETQITSALASGGIYSVTATAGGCSPSASASTSVAVNPLINYYTDADGDGYGSSTATAISSCTNPGAGYVTNNTDCNDGNPTIYPGATEVCNGIDDNCNGQVDEGAGATYYADADGDGYGTSASSVQACIAPAGYVSNNTDCNDANKNVHPGAADICNGIDDNCNGVIDENAISATITPDGSVTFCAGTSLVLTANSGSGISYQWTKNNKNIAGATKQTYISKQKGNYQVKENNSFSCSSTSSSTSVTKVAKPVAIIIPLGNLNICSTGSVTLQANSGSGLSYQWLLGTSSIAGATQRTYVATVKGTYKCVVTNASNCSKTSNGLKVTKTCGKEGEENDNLAQATLSIYPNPTEGKFMLDLKTDEINDGPAKIIVMNIVGQVVYLETSSVVNGELQQEINFPASAASGIYIAKVICNNHTYEGKIIYQH